MNKRFTFKEMGLFIKNHIKGWVLSFVLILGILFAAYFKASETPRENMINVFVTSFSYHSEGIEEELMSVVDDSIERVNVSYYDYNNREAVINYLSTYVAIDSDVIITDRIVGENILIDCFYHFSEELVSELNSSFDFDLKYIKDDNENIIGVLVHDSSDESYNEHFEFINSWLLFKTDIEESDFGIYFHTDSRHNKLSNIKLLKKILG